MEEIRAPIQLFPDESMMAWITFGPIIELARLESPKRPKNWRDSEVGFVAHVSSKRRTMLSKPGGVSSAIIVCEKA